MFNHLAQCKGCKQPPACMQTGAHSPGDLSDFTESQPQGDESFYTS